MITYAMALRLRERGLDISPGKKQCEYADQTLQDLAIEQGKLFKRFAEIDELIAAGAQKEEEEQAGS